MQRVKTRAGCRRCHPKRPIGDRSVGDLGLQLAGLPSISCSTDFSEGRTRTSLRLVFASFMFWASRAGLRSASSRTVVTPAARTSSDPCLAHALDPHVVGDVGPFEQLLLADAGLVRERLASLDRAGGFQQPLGGADAQRFEFRAAKAGRPSISEMGYVMILDIKGAFSELTEARCPCDDLAHLIRSDFVAAKSEKFTRDALNLPNTRTKSHQLGSERHQAAAHQSQDRRCCSRPRSASAPGIWSINA